MKKFYGFLLLVLMTSIQVFGSHMLGGEITYRYLGSNGPADRPFRYQIHFVAYIDRTNNSNWPCGNLGAVSQLAIYDKATNEKIPRIIGVASTLGRSNWDLPNHGEANGGGQCPFDPYELEAVRPVIIKKPVSCVVPGLDPSVFSIAITDTTFEVQLPFSAGGYYVKYENNARTGATTNINTQTQPGNTWLGDIPSPIFANNSPQFLEDAVPFFCTGDTATIANNATDPDGDRLIYSFVHPFGGEGFNVDVNPGPTPDDTLNPAPNYVAPELAPYQTGYDVANPFGSAGFATINPTTGLTKYYTNQQGQYAVAVEIQEFRTLSNGTEIMIATTRREFLVVVKDCDDNPLPTPTPAVPPGFTEGGIITVTEGDSVTFPITVIDADTTTISWTSDLIQGTNGYTGSLAIAPTATGIGNVTAYFRWKADCGLTKGQVRSYPINVKYEDRGCPPKTSLSIFTIIVNPFKAPNISGKDSICSTDQSTTYTAPPGTGRQWVMVGGNIVGPSNSSSVNVNFPGDTARIRLVVTSGLGCKDSSSKKITKVPFVPVVASAPSPFVCQDSLTQLGATGGYTSVSWLPVSGLSSPTVRNPGVAISDTAEYIVTSNGPGGCVAKDTVSLKWIPRIANAGIDSILCSGLKRGIGTAQPTGYSHYSYSWSPSSGVLSDTSFKTEVLLTNTGNSVQQFTFIQTATHRASLCKSTDTVTIAVKPLPVVNAGADTATICSGASAMIGTVDTPLATYAWNPASGLGSPDKDTTSVTLINPDSLGALIQKFVLTKTEILLNPLPGEPSCTNVDSILVKVNPLPAFPLALNDSICSGFSTQIGTAAVSGFSYAWSPTRGLSHPDSSLTNISLTNLSQNPGDTLYTLTVTNTTTTCNKAKELTFRVNPLPTVTAGIDTALCSGDTIRIGELEEAGFSYAWTPGTGLSTPVMGNPKIGLTNPNTGGNSLSFQYNVLKTNNRTTCKNTDSVLVTVKPLPIANAAGSDSLVVCSKSTLQLGEAALLNHLYQWVPDSAITSSTVSNPVLNINNPTQIQTLVKYTVKVTNSITTCKNSDSVFVKINPLPIVPLVYSDTSVCSGDTISIGGAAVAGYAYAWSPKAQLADSTLSLTGFSAINAASVPAVYSFNLLVTNEGTTCQNSKPLQVHVNPLPQANAGLDNAFCSRDTIQIGLPPVNPGWTYAWSPATGILNPNISNPLVSLLNGGSTNTTQTYQLTVTDTLFSTRCAVADEVTLTIKPLPVATASTPTDTLTTCSTVGIQLGVAPDPGLTYSWAPGTGLSNNQIANPTATLTSIGAQGITKFIVSVTDPVSTCSNTDSAWVKVNPLPIVNVGLADSLCSGDTIMIGPGGTLLTTTYAWTPAIGLSAANTANPQLTLTNLTQNVVVSPYQLVVREIQTGCKDSSTLNVRVNPLPIVDAGTDKTMCSGETVGVGFNNTSLGINFSWQPNPGLNFTNISNPNFTRPATETVKDTLYLLATNGTTQCKGTDFSVVTTNPRPTPLVFAPFSPTVCPFTSNVPYSVSHPTGIPQSNSYAWTIVGGVQSSGANTQAIGVNWSGPNPTAKIYVVPTTALGCVGSKDSISITLNQNLNPPKPVGDSILCSYTKTGKLYSTVPTPGSNYTWKLVNAAVDSTVSSNGNTVIDWNTNNGTGKIWIQQQSSTIDPNTGTPVQCYGRSDTLFVKINPSPDSTLTINGLSSFCFGPQASELFNLPGFASSTYNWSVLPSAPFASANGNDSILVAWEAPGGYVVRVQETSDKGCPGKVLTRNVQVNPLPQPTVSSTGFICPNSLSQTYVGVSAPGFENSTYSWIATGADSLKGQNEKTAVVFWNNGGVYTLTLRETSAAGCSMDAPVTLNYDPSTVQLQNVSLLEDVEDQVALNFSMASQTTNPGLIEIWRRDVTAQGAWAAIETSAPKNLSNYIDQPGSTSTHIYAYEIRGTNSCNQRIASNIHNTIVLTGEAMQQDETAMLHWNGYEGWASGARDYSLLRKVDGGAMISFDEGIAPATTLHRDYQVAGDGFNQCFRVVANENAGNFKSYSNSVCVKFENPMVFYNLVTANGDKVNDTWMIKNLKLYPQNEVEVFDRWGRSVFKKSNYREDDLWDAKDVQGGIYFYKFSVTGQQEYNGWIQIVK